MGLIVFQKNWLTGMTILILALSMFSLIKDYQRPQSNIDHNSYYLHLTGITNEVFISKEQYSGYLAAFTKPLKLIVNNLKYLYIPDYKTVNSKFIMTLNLDVSFIVIITFAIFYRLSRTSFEKPSLRNDDWNLPKANFQRVKYDFKKEFELYPIQLYKPSNPTLAPNQ